MPDYSTFKQPDAAAIIAATLKARAGRGYRPMPPEIQAEMAREASAAFLSGGPSAFIDLLGDQLEAWERPMKARAA